MFLLLYTAIDVIPSALILTPFFIVWQMKFRKTRKFSSILLLSLFSCYILAVFSVTGIPAIGTFAPDIHLNLIPFETFQNYSIHYFLNIFLFIPLGLMLPILWEPFTKFKNTLLTGFGFSLFIEISQLLTIRVTDIDDLITNTFGSIIGFLIITFCMRMNWLHTTASTEQHESNIKELFIVLGADLFVWIFITPFISNLLSAFLL